MSATHAQARCGARDVLVVAGYDGPLHEVFLEVLTAHHGELRCRGGVLYASVHEPWPTGPSGRPSPVNWLDSASSFRTAC